ncbi:hypothetical protein ACSVDM_27115 [Nocardia sp. JW2]
MGVQAGCWAPAAAHRYAAEPPVTPLFGADGVRIRWRRAGFAAQKPG